MRISVQRLRHVMGLCAPSIGREDTGLARFMLFQDGFAVGNNGQFAIAANLPEVGDERFLIPHRTMVDTVKFIPANTLLDITSDGMGTRIKGVTGGFATTLHNAEVLEFPDFPDLERTGGGEVDGDQFIRHLSELVTYASKQADRPALQGICLTLGEELEVVAADGFRLAWRVLPLRLPANQDQKPRVTIPAITIRALDRLWKAADKSPRASRTFDASRLMASPQLQVAGLAAGRRFMQIEFGVSKVSFNVGEATLISNTIDADFPNYHQLIPKKFNHSVVFDAGTAYRAVRQLAPVARTASNIVRLSWGRGQLTFSAASDSVGESSVTIEVDINGRASHNAFNIRYLLEMLKDKDGPFLMETNQPAGPGQFTNYGSPNLLLMTMKVVEPMAEAPGDQEGGEATEEADQEPTSEAGAGVTGEGNDDDGSEQLENDDDEATTESTTE